MFEVLERKKLVPNLVALTVRAPGITDTIRAGQFVIVRASEDGERIPLSVADWDRETGSLTMIFMIVGASTDRLAGLEPGQEIPTVVGPLGKATEIDHFGTVVCVGGCYGIGSLYPVIKALHQKGNQVVAVQEARSRNLLYWREKIEPLCDRFITITRDGSAGLKGHVPGAVKMIEALGIKPHRVIANGCTFLVYKTAREFGTFQVPVIVSLNTIMIDGTGMCGVCRVTVDGQMKFACVDGPEFDGRLVDWQELFKRRKQYMDEEAFLVHDSGCGRI